MRNSIYLLLLYLLSSTLPVKSATLIYCGVFITALFLLIAGEHFTFSVLKKAGNVRNSLLAVLLFGIVIMLKLHPPLQVWIEALLLFFFAASVAQALSKSLKHPSELLLVLAVAAAADVISSFLGPTRDAAEVLTAYYENPAEIAEPLINHLMFRIPVLSTVVTIPLFSVTDWFFIALVHASAIRFSLKKELYIHPKIPLSLPVIGLALGMVTAQLSGLFIPGIVPIAIASGVGILRSPEARIVSEDAGKALKPISLLLLTVTLLLIVKRV